MKKFLLLLLLAVALQKQPLIAQNQTFPNAIHAKINVSDYGVLFDNNPRLGQGFELGYFHNVSSFINVGIPFKLGLGKLPRTEGNTVTTSLDVLVHLENTASESKLLPYAFVGAGYFLEKFKNGHAQFPFGGGLKFKVSQYAFANLQLEYRKALVDERDNLQLGVGFVYLLHKPDARMTDSDRDGTPDAIDKCPQVAGSTTAFGCPDQDKDGIADAEDTCPTQPGPAATMGCPDTDNDGIADTMDDCPDQAGTLKGCPDTDNDGVADKDDLCPTEVGRFNGCPDTDFDGVADKDDKCPTVAGTIENNGCPDMIDSDGDGFDDTIDLCPTTAGTLYGCPDTDGDKVADIDDKCPTEPGTKENDGCPAAKDSDGDGFDDANDACPTSAGTANGCPDADSDGIADKDDLCPTEAGIKANDGCPPVKDTDGDGVDDKRDPCPTTAGAFGGCPDTDNDGVADNLDKCPTTPGLSTNYGCPEVKKETKTKLAAATKAVQFETSKSVLKNESFAVLDEMVDILRQYPDYTLSISGHTDDIGDDARNLRLSNDRAKACYDYLIFRGIKANRLRYAGFGENRPIADNSTSDGRNLNRRVEFELILE